MICFVGNNCSAYPQEVKDLTTAVGNDYTIGVDDVITVKSVGQSEIDDSVTVLSDGTIHITGITDDIKAEGLTLAQLKVLIHKGLDRLYNNLELSVAIKESHSRMVTVIGTKLSGQFPLRKGMRVSSLIALGGGLAAKTQLVSGNLLRDFKNIKLDIMKIAGQTPDSDADLLLKTGDTLVLNSAEEAPLPVYSVLGAVFKPGNFPLPIDGSSVSIAHAIADSGGTLERASLTGVTIQRGNSKILLNLYPLLIEGKPDTDSKFELKNGDVVFIPEITSKYLVLGQVLKPGIFLIPESKQISIFEALATAGGSSSDAELHKASLTRVVGGKQVNIAIDYTSKLTKVSDSSTLMMQNGDMLYIPIRRRKSTIAESLSPLFLLGTLGLRPF